MTARLPKRAALFLLATAVSLSLIASPGASKTSNPADLRVSPGKQYVGGQAMNFEGSIGRPGVRTIHMQFHMNRPGDDWGPVEGFRGTTRADGSFDFTFTAPSMFGIRYRVVAGGLATPPWTFNAQTQDLTLEPVGQPVAGRPFTIEVDTTPDDLFRRPDTKELRPYIGRGLILQKRVAGGTWEQVGGSSEVGQYGMGYFRDVVVAAPGTVVYRAIQQDWTQGANEIGWFPSFPTYVNVLDPSDAKSQPAAPAERAVNAVRDPLPRTGTKSTTASQRYGWAPSLFDFAWEFGESLTSNAHRGTNRNGRWLDYSNGGGRVAKHNGGLMLDSKRDNDVGPGDFGTTSATLRGLPMKYGRWETRLRIKSDESNARDYRVRVELVPDTLRDCGARTITVAEVAPHANRVLVGVNAINKKWTRTVSGVAINNQSIAFAVEVSKKHITWFLEGKPIATVKSRAAVSDVPLTLRMSMVGDGGQEMNHTSTISDWQRGFTLARGKKVTSGPALKKSKLTSC